MVTDSHSILARWRKHFSHSYLMYIGLMMISREKYTQQSH
jgi:hypothetical protein